MHHTMHVLDSTRLYNSNSNNDNNNSKGTERNAKQSPAALKLMQLRQWQNIKTRSDLHIKVQLRRSDQTRQQRCPNLISRSHMCRSSCKRPNA